VPAVVDASPRRSWKDGSAMFETIVCGIDGSEAGFTALAQARRLLADGGRLVAVTALDEGPAHRTGFEAPRIVAELRRDADATRARAERELVGVPGASAEVLRGRALEALRVAVEREGADLVAVGSHGTSRPLGAILGSVATALLHETPCSVLLARPIADPDLFPHSIVVGVDGSDCAREAERVAFRIAAATNGVVKRIAALGSGVDLDALDPDVVRHEGDAVVVLESASLDADLIVVGTRGLHGLAAVGSVSERIAHQARSSVLVVRTPGDHR
jgi:nucleotide-binding universal stress UspA family protein